jgi:hypothetical protein
LAVINHLRNRASAPRDDWSAACHRLDHHKAEWLGPIDRKKERNRSAEKRLLSLIIYFAYELDPISIKKRFDRVIEVTAFRAGHFRGDPERQTRRPRHSNGSLGPLFW